MNALLTEQVIPRLGPDAERPDIGDEPDDAAPDDIESPEIPEEDSPNADVPAAVTQALAASCTSICRQNRPKALAELFTAVSKESAEGSEEEMSEDGEDETLETAKSKHRALTEHR